MEYFKINNIKINYILLISLFFYTCKEAENNTNSVNNSFFNSMNLDPKQLKFDIKKYESELIKNPLYEGYWTNKNTFVKQYYTIKEGLVEDKYTKSIVQNYIEEIKNTNLRTKDIFTYDVDGELQSVKHYFADDLEIGKWNFYQNNAIIKTDNKDENYPFSLEKVISFGKENKVDFTKTGKISRFKSPQFNKYIWQLEWNTGNLASDGETYLFKKVILDGSDGKELFSKEYALNPLQR